jgi:hypothetical protein
MEYGRGDKLYGFGRQNGPIRNKQQYNPRNINSEEDFQEIMQREFEHEKELLGITGEKGLSDQYIMLDSFKKNPNSRVDQGEFIFDLAIQGSTGENVIGVRDKLDNIIEIQIGAFYLPPMPPIIYGPADDTFTLTLPSPAISQYYPGQHISVYIKETGLQSYSDSNGKRHNFDLIAYNNTYSEISYSSITNPATDGALLAEPYVGWDTYKFTDPIMDLSKITLQFATPDNPLNFYNDTFYVSTLPITGGIHDFQIVNLDLYNAILSTKYVSGGIVQKIVISGFNCSSTKAYNIINNPYGVIAVLTAPSTIQISPSLIFNVDIPSFNIKVQVLQNRVRIPLKVRRLISRKTNSIIPI